MRLAGKLQEVSKPKRVVGRPFRPGQSGNPSGKPKGMVEVQRLAREHATEAIQALVEALNHRRTRVAAAIALLDRGFGRPAQHTQITRSPLDDIDPQTLTTLAETLEQLGHKAPDGQRTVG